MAKKCENTKIPKRRVLYLRGRRRRIRNRFERQIRAEMEMKGNVIQWTVLCWRLTTAENGHTRKTAAACGWTAIFFGQENKRRNSNRPNNAFLFGNGRKWGGRLALGLMLVVKVYLIPDCWLNYLLRGQLHLVRHCRPSPKWL